MAKSQRISIRELKFLSADEILARAPVRVEEKFEDLEGFITGDRFSNEASYVRIHFRAGGTAWMDAETGVLIRGFKPKRARRGMVR